MPLRTYRNKLRLSCGASLQARCSLPALPPLAVDRHKRWRPHIRKRLERAVGPVESGASHVNRVWIMRQKFRSYRHATDSNLCCPHFHPFAAIDQPVIAATPSTTASGVVKSGPAMNAGEAPPNINVLLQKVQAIVCSAALSFSLVRVAVGFTRASGSDRRRQTCGL